MNPPKEIDDPEDKKPEDWVEEAKIPDPEATKVCLVPCLVTVLAYMFES